jgi:signal transduction histidine kinase
MTRAFGLRTRLLAALLLTSAVTLGFAALALLSPLKQRLRTDSTQNVTAAIGAAKPGFEEVDIVANGIPDRAVLEPQARSLERRTNARVIIVDAHLNRIYDTEPHEPVDLSLARSSLLADRTVQKLRGEDLKVAEPVRIAGQRYVVFVTKLLAYVQASTRVVRDVFIKAAAVGLIVALVLGIGLSATLVRRLRRLRDATRDLDASGLEAAALPLHDNTRDEIGELARSFAAMRSRLRQQEDARRAFVATASHELRTPIASLDGMLELIVDDLEAEPVDVEDARERIARAQEQSRRLANLASDLLDLSRIDADITLRSEPVELVEIARAVTAEFELRARERDVQVELSSLNGPCWAEGDPGSVARIVRILLDNALRVAPPGSPVIVRIGGSERSATLEVRDFGPGVCADERELIFERFQRGRGRGHEGGFGLGLAIGRELATRMGGALELRSSERGAAFELRLHVAQVGVEVA